MDQSQKIYYDDGNIKSHVFYNNKMNLHGVCIFYYPNGKKHEEINYKNGLIDGTYIKYHENGVVQEAIYNYNKEIFSTKYSNTGIKIQEINYIINLNKHKEEQESYKNKIYHGMCIWYCSKTGRKIKEANYKKGKYHGIYKDYYDNGNIRNEINYYKGKINGYHKKYYSTGQIKSEKNYKDGKKHGLCTIYSLNNQKKYEKMYDFSDNIPYGVILYNKNETKIYDKMMISNKIQEQKYSSKYGIYDCVSTKCEYRHIKEYYYYYSGEEKLSEVYKDGVWVQKEYYKNKVCKKIIRGFVNRTYKKNGYICLDGGEINFKKLMYECRKLKKNYYKNKKVLFY